MFADEDARRQFEGQRDLAAADPAKITAVPELQGALTFSQGRLRAAHRRHGVAITALLKEDAETQKARGVQLKAAGAVDQAWRYLRGRVSDRLLNPPPEVVLSPQVREDHQALLLALFPHPAAEFSRQTPERKVLLLRTAAGLVEAERAALGDDVDELLRRFPPVADVLEQANERLNKELRESRAAQAELEQARAEYDRLHAAWQRMVESILGDADRLAELPQFIRARDPAYRARRAAGRSMKEEEGIEAITTPLGTTPDAIELPPPV